MAALTHGETELVAYILGLSCEVQELVAKRIAANIGYKLVADTQVGEAPADRRLLVVTAKATASMLLGAVGEQGKWRDEIERLVAEIEE